MQYLNDLCKLTDRDADVNSEIYLAGDMNIDCLASQCPVKMKISLVIRCYWSMLAMIS